MVAIVTGKGAGLGNGSVSVLAGSGQLDSGTIGRAGETVTVNAATGNLIVTDRDEMLVGRGPDAVISRAYNSLGAWDGDNPDNWRESPYRRVHDEPATYGASGSTVTRTDWDGSETVYTWNATYIDATHGAYVATAGGGAYDTLVKSGSVWTWTDGDTQAAEAYDSANSGRITSRSDAHGNSLTYTYTSGLITRVTTSSGDYTDLVYGGTAGNQLRSLVTSAGGTTTRVYYVYESDASGARLVTVQVNLDPSDNSAASGANYETSYTYVGSTNRIATMTQSDGTLFTIGYTQYGSDYRVSSVAETVATGVTRTTSFLYDTALGITTVTDAAGQATRLAYDANGNLVRITTPPVGAAATPQVTEFGYEADGDVAWTRQAGNTITYSYDAHGNRVFERDGAGNTLERAFSAKNELLTETRYLVADPDGAGSGTPSSPTVTNYVYDAKSHLRFTVSPEGRVTEYRYDGFGQQVSKIDYAGPAYASTMAEAALAGWVAGMTDRSGGQRTDSWYDFRGNVTRTVSYASLDAYGEGTQDPQAVFAGLNTSVAQQADGTYRITKTSGGNSWNGDAHSTVKAEGDFVLQVRIGQSGSQLAVGIASSRTSTGFTTISEGLYFDPNGVAYHLVSGSYAALPTTGSHTTYVAGDTIWMTRVGTTLTYYKGATLAAAITAGAIRSVTGVTGTLYLDADLYAAGNSVDIGFTPQPITVGANTGVVAQPDGLTRITRTSGGNAWNADARGSAAATGDFVLQVRPQQANKFIAAGVSTAPGADSGLTLNYGFYLNANGVLAYTEAGSSPSLGTSFAAGDNLWLVRTGSTIGYYKGATLESAMAAGALRTVTGVTGTLYFDSSFYDLGGAIDVAFTPGALSAPEVSRTDYVYDAAGNLLSRAVAGQGVETFVRDGLGRITASKDFNGAATSIAYTDASTGGVTTVTLANGLVQTSTYDRAGELIAYAESGAGISGSPTTHYSYDSLGQLRAVVDPTGLGHYYFYDAIGRKIAEADADGSVTEYRYDARDNLTSTTAYANRLTGTQIASLASGTLPAFDTVRPATDTADDRWSWNVYDLADRLIETVDGTGSVTLMSYDGASRLISTTQRANLVSPANLTAMKADAVSPTNLWAGGDNGALWALQNVDMASAGTIAGFSAYTMTVHSSGWGKVSQTNYDVVAAGDTANLGVWLKAGTSATIPVFGLYGSATGWGPPGGVTAIITDGPGTLTQSPDGSWAVSGLSTTQATHVVLTRTFSAADNQAGFVFTGNTAGQSIVIAGPTVTITPGHAVNLPATDSLNDRVSRLLYDKDGLPVGSLDAEGYLTETIYDGAGRKIRTIAYSDATGTTAGLRETGSLADLRASLPSGRSTAKDIRNQWLYDSRGLLRATIDGEGTVTRFDYTPAGHLSQQTSGQKVDPATVYTLATLPAPGSAILETTVWTRNLYGQPLTETRTLTGSTTTTTTFAYDNMRRLVSTVTQAGGADPRTYSQRYDLQGRLSSELSGDGNAELAAHPADIEQIYTDYGTSYAYDAAGRLVSKTGPRGTAAGAVAPRTLYYYNADGALIYEVSAAGEVAKYAYNAFGERTDTFVYTTRVDMGSLAGGTDASPLVSLLTGTPDTLSHTDFNVDGTVKQVIDARSTVTTYSYNAFGELASDVAASGDAAALRTDHLYDRRGLLKSVIADVGDPLLGHKNILTSYGYDAFGREVTLTNALTKVTISTYDRAGRLKSTSVSPDGGTTHYVTGYTYDARGNLVAVTDPLGKITLFVYDKAKRKIATIDALGAVTTTSYDADGRVAATRAYSDTIDPSPLATLQAALEVSEAAFATTLAGLTLDAAADQVTRYAYDKDGQLRFTVDALRHVVEHVHDNAGNEIRTIAYVGTIGTDGTGVYSAAFIAGQIDSLGMASAADTRVSRSVYDAANRLAYSIDALNQVTAFTYDARGQLVKSVEFAAPYTAGGDPLAAAMDTWRGTSPVTALAASDRTTGAWYDKAGQLAFSIDAEGFVTRIDYDKLGNVTKRTAYADPYTANDTTSLTDLTTAFASPPATKRVTQFTYDSAGRLETTIDPEGFVTKLVRDAMGQILSSTEDFGGADASTTAYIYDDVGRVTTMTRASGASEAVTTYAFYDAAGNRTAAIDGDKYLTVWTYDATGNVSTETHYATAITASFTTATPVTTLQGYAGAGTATSAAYDAFGRVTGATDARGTTTSTSYDLLDRISTQTEQPANDTGASRVTSYTYDSFGDAVKIHDARGNDSFAWYDKLGRVSRQVDAQNYVTDTDYTRGGQVWKVKRYATAATGTISETAMPPAPAGSVAITIFGYNKRDELTSTTDAENHTETYTLNAFGERTEFRNKLYDRTSVTRFATYSYDKRGLMLTETLPADTLDGSGTTIPIVNTYAYDHRGNLTTKVEAFGAPEARTTTYSYDKLDRLTRTQGDAVTVVNDDLTETTGVVPTETYQYDHRGNLIETVTAGIKSGWTDTHGARTVTWYDGFGRKTDETQLVATVAGTDKGTLSRWTYDANGNVLTARVYGDLVTMPALATGAAPTPVDSTNCRLTSYTWYLDNRLKETRVAGLTTGEWNGTNYVLTAGLVGGSLNPAAEITTLAEYDAAGNIVRQQDGRGNSTYMWYDKLGRMIAQVDAERYLTVWTRDAEGNATGETRYADRIAAGETFTPTTDIATLIGYADDDPAHDRTTSFIYDLNGRRLTETRESVAYVAVDSGGTMTSGTASSLVTYTYDGLGNVLTKVEANNDTTSYTYDAIGRLTLETGQTFTDYLGNAATTPRTSYIYDGLNNLKSTRVQAGASPSDANDRITTYSYGAGGRLAGVTDAAHFGAATPTHRYGYDAAGRLVRDSYVRNASGVDVTEAAITLYDRLGRAIVNTHAHLEGSAWVYTTGGSGTPYYDAVRTAYNAYGEVSGRGVTGGSTAPGGAPVYQEFFDYDAGGRLWRSNTGDGVLRFHLYDKAGNETLTLASAGADLSGLTLANYTGSLTASGGTGTAGAVTTVTVHDGRGQAVSTREPDREVAGGTATIVRAKAYNAFGEVLSETDARGYTTTYGYNAMGSLLSRVSPQVSVTGENGTVSSLNPTERYYYDISGRLVGTEDANSVQAHASDPLSSRIITKRLLLAGTGHGDDEALVVKEFHPDGGVFETRYDVFGDARVLRNELYNGSNATATDDVQTFDKLGQLITLQHRGAALTDHYEYDVLGQRTAHWNSQLGNTVRETTDYDAQGRVIATVAFGGDAMAYRYARTTSLTTTGLADYDGWVKTSVNVSANNGAEVKTTESTDYFGRTIASTDYAGTATAMTFDRGGRLVTQAIAGGATTSYTWFNTGLQASVTTGSAVSTYRYDASGNRTYEHYVIGSTVYQAGTASYDALNRMTAFDDAGSAGGSAVAIDYEYDAVGNVRHIKSAYTPLGDSGDPAASASGQDYWYVYDSMNRFVITQGQLVKWATGNHIARDALDNYIVGDAARGQSGAVIDRYLDGTAITWDKAGNRMTAARTLAEDAYESESETSYIAFTEQKETYTYSPDGYLVRTDIGLGSPTGYASYDFDEYRKPSAAPTGVGRAVYTRDAMGRVTGYSEYNLSGYVSSSPGSNLSYSRIAAYDAGGRVVQDTTVSVRSDGIFKAVSDYYYNASLASGLWSGVVSGGYYMGGAATRVATRNYKNDVDTDAADTLTVNAYVWGQGGAVLTHVDYDKDTGDSSNTVWTSAYARDGSGYLTGATITDERPRTVTLVNDAQGRVLQRDEADGNATTGDPRQLHYYMNGVPVGDISNNGTSNTDYASSLAAHTAPPAYGPFQGGVSSGMAHADFDQSYDAINGLTYDSTAQSYTVQTGDTLSAIAQQLWGDASLWYLIAEANGLSGSEPLAPGRILTLPNKVHNLHNNATTWRPYDPNQAQGDLSPTDARKPRSNKCGTFGQILAAVVAVAVAAIVDMIPVVGPILAPYAANAAQQGVLIATGNQDKFSWKSLGTVAVDQFLPKTGNAFLDNAITQKVSMKLGLQDKFSWAGVATAGITAAVAQGVGAILPPGTSATVQHLAVNTAAYIASAAATSLITGEDFGDTLIAALPSVIGSTIGQLATNAVSRGSFGANDKEQIKGALGTSKLDLALKGGLREVKMTSEMFGDALDISNLGPISPLSSPLPALPLPSAAMSPAGRSHVQAVTRKSSGRSAEISAAAPDEIVVTGSRKHQTPWTEIPFIDRGGLRTYSYTALGHGVVRNNERETIDLQHQSVVTFSTNSKARMGYRTIVANGEQLLQVKNLDTNELFVEYSLVEGKGASFYVNPNPVPDLLWTEPTFAIMAAEIRPGVDLGWRSYQFSKDSEVANYGRLLIARDLEKPGSVDANFYRADQRNAEIEARSQAWLAQIDWEAGIIATPMTMLGGGPLGEASSGVWFSENLLGKLGLVRVAAAKSGDALLLERGVTDAGLRQSILNTGFNPAILNDASPLTLQRFDKLFQGTFDAGKSFRGRLGDLSTRARTIETAIGIDRLGLTPEFESVVRLGGGRSRFVDVAGLDANGASRYFQLYREAPGGGIPLREINAANDIFSKTGIRPVMIRTGP